MSCSTKYISLQPVSTFISCCTPQMLVHGMHGTHAHACLAAPLNAGQDQELLCECSRNKRS